jgi:hypothetical protein
MENLDWQSGSVGCVHNSLHYVGPWYTCDDCGLHFYIRVYDKPEFDLLQMLEKIKETKLNPNKLPEF